MSYITGFSFRQNGSYFPMMLTQGLPPGEALCPPSPAARLVCGTLQGRGFTSWETSMSFSTLHERTPHVIKEIQPHQPVPSSLPELRGFNFLIQKNSWKKQMEHGVSLGRADQGGQADVPLCSRLSCQHLTRPISPCRSSFLNSSF